MRNVKKKCFWWWGVFIETISIKQMMCVLSSAFQLLHSATMVCQWCISCFCSPCRCCPTPVWSPWKVRGYPGTNDVEFVFLHGFFFASQLNSVTDIYLTYYTCWAWNSFTFFPKFLLFVSTIDTNNRNCNFTALSVLYLHMFIVRHQFMFTEFSSNLILIW